jgi:membrane peptidoglycan carboxypeptidase
MSRFFRTVAILLATVLIGAVGIAASVAALVPGVRTIWTSSQAAPLQVAQLRPLAQRSTVYAANGDEIGQLGTLNRQSVSLSEVAPTMIDAVVSVEDRTFYTNPGIDLQSIGRALLKNVGSGQTLQGGSTITQQLVKQRILTSERTLSRKVKEATLAWRLNQEYSKNEILEQYLNTVYFGENSYGIAAASERFFGVPSQQLDVAQAALLAGSIRSPSGYDPFNHPSASKSRRAEVLALMYQQHYITKAERDSASKEPLPTTPPAADLRPNSFFVQEVQQVLLQDKRLGATEADRQQALLEGGLKIYTTYDQTAYDNAKAAIASTVPNRPPITAAIASMDPTNGDVRALAQGTDFGSTLYDLTTHNPGFQPGSTYKVIVLAAALEAGYSINDTIDGSSPCTVSRQGFGKYTANNADGSAGVETLRSQLVHSVNCAFIRLITAVGPAKVIDMAHRLGIKQAICPYCLSIAIGTNNATPLEMATVYSTLADGGVRHDPVFVTKVVGPDGALVFQQDNTGVKALDPEIAKTVVDAMRGVITGGTGTGARLDNGRVAAGKTGTTDSEVAAWFCGFVPQLTTCVWMGSGSGGNISMSNLGGVKVFGGTYPATMFRVYMNSELAGQPNLPFDAPDQSLWPHPRYIDPETGRTNQSAFVDTTTTAPLVVSTTPTTPVTTPTTPPTKPTTTTAVTTTT